MASGTGRFRIQKLVRQRFGIAAPRVEIQTRIPWYWRWVGLAVLLGVAAAAAGWVYDAGRRLARFGPTQMQERVGAGWISREGAPYAGFDHNEVQEELRVVRKQLVSANAELERLRALANAAE